MRQKDSSSNGGVQGCQRVGDALSCPRATLIKWRNRHGAERTFGCCLIRIGVCGAWIPPMPVVTPQRQPQLSTERPLIDEIG